MILDLEDCACGGVHYLTIMDKSIFFLLMDTSSGIVQIIHHEHLFTMDTYKTDTFESDY